jgi:hypothetical protein
MMHKFDEPIASIFTADGAKLYVGVGWGPSPKPNGIYISPNSGIDWKFSSFGGGQQGLICWDIERDQKDGTLYVATEIFNHPQPYHPPFYRSQNDGQTWKDVAGTLPWHVIAEQIRPADSYVYALTEGLGLYGSANHGDTWIASPGSIDRPSDSLLMDSKLPKRLFGGAQKFGNLNGGAFMSINGGNSFKPIGLQGVTVGGMSLNANSTRLYAAAYASGVYVSTVPPMIVPN